MVRAGQHFSFGVALAIEHLNGHVLAAEVAIHDGDLVVADAITGGEPATVKSQQAAERMRFVFVGEAVS